MLSEGGEESNVQWFAGKVAADEAAVFETTSAFVQEYCDELRRLAQGGEGRRREAVAMMRSHMPALSRRVEQEEAALQALGLDCTALAEDSVLSQLVELSRLLGVNRPLRYGEYQLTLDALARQQQQTSARLAQAASLQRASAELAEDIRGQQARLTAAKEDFDRWARRDCELGVRELEEATTVVCQKRAEYGERLAVLEGRWGERAVGGPDDLGASALLAQLERLREGRRRLERAQGALAPYHQLPPDVALASVQLEEARHELARLMAQRDSILRSYRR